MTEFNPIGDAIEQYMFMRKYGWLVLTIRFCLKVLIAAVIVKLVWNIF